MPPAKTSANAALIKACNDGDLTKIAELVNGGADVNTHSPGNETPLYIAVQNNHTHIVEYLLTKGVKIENGYFGISPLYKACKEGLLDIVRMLVYAGANVNLKNPNGYTPLYVAVEKKHLQVVKFLLSIGANLEEKNGFPGPNQETALHKACIDGSLDIVIMLVDAGANVNSKYSEGYTPLYIAIEHKHLPVVEYLIAKGVDLEEKTKNGYTVLHKAVLVDSLEIVKLLINAGANSKAIDNDGKTARDFAIVLPSPSIVEYLDSKIQEPVWLGFTQSDISKFDTIFETNAPYGQLPPAVNYACCPVCLKFVERSEACMYMSHKCTDFYHTELYNKYKNPEGLICWCTICGRICFGHRHYTKTFWDSEKPALLPSGDPFENDCKKTNGGGGIEEKLARFRALRNTAFDLQANIDSGEVYTVPEAMNELVQQCWNASSGLVTKRIMTQKKWNRPITNFRPNVPQGAAAVIYPKDDSSAYEAPRVFVPGNANFGPNAFTFDDSEPVIQFRHKKADGTMFTHPLINKDTLLMFLSNSGPEWPCFEPSCGGHLWPTEVIQALENPLLVATDEEKTKGQAYKDRVHGSVQNGGRRQATRRKKTQRR